MSKRNDYMGIVFTINKAIDQTEQIQCDCNKYTESQCDRCILIESLTKQMNDMSYLATKPNEEY